MADLERSFVEALPPALRVEASSAVGLGDALAQWVERGRTGAAFQVDAAVFVAHLATRLDGIPSDATQWDALAAADLHLACACATGNQLALGVFERRYGGAVLAKATKMVRDGVTADEVRQQVWHKLFVGLGGGRPRIGDYTGRGTLLGWLNVIVARTAIDLNRSAGSAAARPLAQGLLHHADDPELTYLKQHYRDAFEGALQTAIGELSPRQRNMLAYNLIDRLDTNQIGSIYGVHRTSAGRWLADAREALLTRTRRELMRALEVGGDDVDSIMRLIGSRLDVTFRHLLRPGGEG
ncbi:MAG: sigma-70 family RNA polymerase sigma factor [Deltaproteobacteria bacterium]|nr:sigma-70 family RNA polymerase sigma factor [Deltaproteobacteria bacterium]